MIIVEVKQSYKDIIDEIITSDPNEGVIKVDAMVINYNIQILIPLVSITVPVFSQLLQKYMDNQRVTIKYDGVEISAKSAEQAMELLEKLKERKAEIAEKADAGEN